MFNRKEAQAPDAALDITVQDGVIAEAWGRTLTEWTALTDAERQDLRSRVVYAPNFSVVMS